MTKFEKQILTSCHLTVKEWDLGRASIYGRVLKSLK